MATHALGDTQPLELSGKLEAFGTAYAQKSGARENTYGELRFLPKLAFSPTESISLHIEGDFRLDTGNYAHGYIDDAAEKNNRWSANLREAYYEEAISNLRVRLGKQIFEWGMTDTVSPGDNLNPRDFLDFVRARDKVGIPSLSLKYGNDTFIEGVYVPWLTPSKLPTGNQRWSRDLPSGIIAGQPENQSDYKPQYAARIGSNFSGYDFGASVYNGYSYSPFYELKPTSPSTARLAAVYNRQSVYAVALAKSLDTYVIRSEIGYFDQKNASDFVQYVVGVDREWVGIFFEDDTFYALVQYADSTVTNQVPTLPDTFDLRRVLDNCLMAKIKYSPTDSKIWEFGIEGSYNLRDHDWLLTPSVAKKINDELNIKLSADLLGGPADSFFGGYKKNDRIAITATWFF